MSLRFNGQTRAGTLLAIACAAACATACGGEVGSITVGGKAPVFSLINLRGDRVSLQDVSRRGPTLVNFWASWCDPCKAEVPILNELQHKLAGRGVTVIGVSVEEPREVVDAFVRKHHIDYPVLLDVDGAVSRRYGLIGMPMNVIVDRQGVVSMWKSGAVDDRMMAALSSMGSTAAASSHGS